MSRLLLSDCRCEACRARRVAYLWVKSDRRRRRGGGGYISVRGSARPISLFHKVKSLFHLS